MTNENRATDDDLKYSNYIVGFLDVLGFSKLCLQSEKSATKKAKLNTIYATVDKVRNELSHIESKRTIESFVVSDSIMLVLKVDGSKPNIGEVRNFVLAAGKIQYELAINGIWLRGGISFGKLFVNTQNKQIFGPALIKAVGIEKNLCIHPRILMDTSFITLLNFQSAKEVRDELNKNPDNNNYIQSLYSWNSNFPAVGSEDVPNDAPFIVNFMRSTDKPDFKKIATEISKELADSLEYYDRHRRLADFVYSIYHRQYLGIGQLKHELELLLK